MVLFVWAWSLGRHFHAVETLVEHDLLDDVGVQVVLVLADGLDVALQGHGSFLLQRRVAHRREVRVRQRRVNGDALRGVEFEERPEQVQAVAGDEGRGTPQQVRDVAQPEQQSEAKQSKAKQSKAKQSKAKQGETHLSVPGYFSCRLAGGSGGSERMSRADFMSRWCRSASDGVPRTEKITFSWLRRLL